MIYERLAAYYPCDATHSRSVTWDYTGTYPLDGGLAGSATGKVREALSFVSASSLFRSRTDAAGLRQLRGITCWVKFTTLAANMTLVAKGSSGTDANHSIKLAYNNSTGKIDFIVGDGASSTTVSTTGLTLAASTWYFIRAWNDASEMGVEVNGTVYGTATSRTPLSETGTLYLGRDTSGNYLNGLLDEVALYSTAPTFADGAFFYNGGDGQQIPEPDSLPGPSGRAGETNAWIPPSFAQADEGSLYVAHGKRHVQRFTGYGDFGSAGVPLPTTKPRIASSGSGRMMGDIYAYVRNLDADGRVSSMSPISDVKHVYGDSTGDIEGATNSSPIVVTSTAHGLSSGDRVRITGQRGLTAMNGIWYVTVLTADTFELDGSIGNGDWIATTDPNITVQTRQQGRAGVNCVQSLAFASTPSGGTFTITFRGETSPAISATASAGTIQGVLRSMGTIGDGNVVCAGGAMGTAAVTVTFQGTLASQFIEPLTVDTTNTLGASVTVSVVTLTQGSPGANEVQVLTFYGTPTGGTFTLTYDGQTTGAIAYNASAATVDTALEALSNIGAGDVTCTGGSLPGTPITITFGGALANTNVPLITATVSSLTGGSISAAISTVTAGVAATGDGLIHYWKFDESSGTRYDSAGSCDLAVVSGSPFSDSGKISNCVAADAGSSAQLSGTCSDSVSSGISFDAWIYFPPVGIGQTHYALSLRVTAVISASLFRVRLTRLDGTNSFVSFLIGGSAITATVSASTWHHIACVFDATTFATRLYIDGALSTSSSVSTQAVTLTTVEVFPSTGAFAAVKLDEMAVWNRAITAADVTSRYNSGSGTTSPLSAGTNEVQRLTISGTPAQGSCAVTYGGQTATINYDDTASEMESSLEALSSIGTGNISCTGGPLPGTPIDYEFIGDLATTNVAEATVNDSLLKHKLETTTSGLGAQTEVQRFSATPAPASGTWTATYDGQTTSAMAFDISASAFQTALEALSNLAPGDVTVTGGPLATAPFVVTFGGTLANTNVVSMTAASSMLGAVPELTVTTTTTGLEPLNEIQDIVPDTTIESGTWTITGLSTTTSSLASDATASDVQTALEAIYGVGNIEVTGGPITSQRMSLTWIEDYAATNVAEVTIDSSSLRSGGWGIGAGKLTYEDVEVPTDLRVVRRQVLRNKFGDASVFYIDVDTTDIVSTTFDSTNNEEDLDESVVLIDADGVDQNLARHGEPPHWKRVVASYQNRVFYAVDYVERGISTTNGSLDAAGNGTDWPSIFDGLSFYGEDLQEPYVIDSLNADEQTAQFADNAETSTIVGNYAIRAQVPDGLNVYHSWRTMLQDYPESVHPGEPFRMSRDKRNGEMTGLYSFDGRFFVAYQHQTYRYSFNKDPAATPDGDGSMIVAVPRGLVNHRCVAYLNDLAYCLDPQGCYKFNGDAVGNISEKIAPLFEGRNSDFVIDWSSSKWFHAAAFTESNTVRFFVSLAAGYPRHAICYDVTNENWWLEEYPFPITASCSQGGTAGRRQVLLGSSAWRVFSLTGDYDGVANPTSTLRGTVTTGRLCGLEDSTAAFGSELVGLPVKIVSGTGHGQTRIITAVTATTLSVEEPWLIRPGTDSTYQIAGIEWSIRTGTFALLNGETDCRSLSVTWEPVENEATADLTITLGMNSDPVLAGQTRSADDSFGFSTVTQEPQRSVSLTRTTGYVYHKFDRVTGTPEAPKYMTLELEGTTNGESHRIYGLGVEGLS